MHVVTAAAVLFVGVGGFGACVGDVSRKFGVAGGGFGSGGRRREVHDGLTQACRRGRGRIR